MGENEGHWQGSMGIDRWVSRSNARQVVSNQACRRKNGLKSSGWSLEVFIEGEWRWIYACTVWASQAVYNWKCWMELNDPAWQQQQRDSKGASISTRWPGSLATKSSLV